MPLNPNDFFEKMRPEAERLRQLLGAGPNVVPVILSQWAHESGFEMDTWVGHRDFQHNYTGLTNGGPPNFRSFASPEEHTRAQAEALLDPNYAWGYGQFIQAARENQDPITLARLLGISPWDGAHYKGDSNQPGEQLIDMMVAYDLAPTKPGDVAISGGELGKPISQERPTLQNIWQRLNETIFSGAWWLRAGQLLALLFVAALLIYVAIKGLGAPAPATEEEG